MCQEIPMFDLGSVGLRQNDHIKQTKIMKNYEKFMKGQTGRQFERASSWLQNHPYGEEEFTAFTTMKRLGLYIENVE